MAAVRPNHAHRQTESQPIPSTQEKSGQTLSLSTGEISIKQKLERSKLDLMQGHEVRAISIRVGDGSKLSTAVNLHGHDTPADFNDAIGSAALENFGHARSIHLNALAANYAGHLAFVKTVASGFVRKHKAANFGGAVCRMLGRFAAVAGAGELAARLGIVPWPEGDAFRAVSEVFAAWIAQRTAKPLEVTSADAALRALLAEKESNFTEKPNKDSVWTIRANYFGVMVRIRNIECYAVASERLASAMPGIDVDAMVRRLVDDGAIVTGNGHNACLVQTPHGRSRLLCIRKTFMHDIGPVVEGGFTFDATSDEEDAS